MNEKIVARKALGGCYYKDYLLPSQRENFELPKLFFLKTYKVGSSTLAGILRGLGDKYGKVTLTPPTGFIKFTGPEDFEEVIKYQNITDGKVDIICNHVEGYQTSLISKYLGPDYFKMTLIRHPIQRSLSGYYFSRGRPFCQYPVEEWVKNCTGFKNGCYDVMQDRDLAEFVSPKEAIDSFDLVLITERYTESLIVLMWKLGLKITDLLYITSKKGIRNEVLTEEQERKFGEEVIQENPLDLELFGIGNEVLDETIAKLPENYMSQNKMILDDMIKAIELACPFSIDDCYFHDNGCARKCIKDWIASNVQC